MRITAFLKKKNKNNRCTPFSFLLYSRKMMITASLQHQIKENFVNKNYLDLHWIQIRITTEGKTHWIRIRIIKEYGSTSIFGKFEKDNLFTFGKSRIMIRIIKLSDTDLRIKYTSNTNLLWLHFNETKCNNNKTSWNAVKGTGTLQMTRTGFLTGGGSGLASRQRMRTDLQLNFSVNFISFVQDLWNHLEENVDDEIYFQRIPTQHLIWESL